MEDLLANADLGSAGGRAVPRENLHVTLVFLGEVEPADVDTVLTVLPGVVAECEPIRLSIAGAGGFEGRGAATAWVGVAGQLDRLHTLVDVLGENVETILGRPRESRPYRPHLSLARNVDLTSAGTRTFLERMADYRGPDWLMTECAVVSSAQTPGSPRYTPIANLPLGGT